MRSISLSIAVLSSLYMSPAIARLTESELQQSLDGPAGDGNPRQTEAISTTDSYQECLRQQWDPEKGSYTSPRNFTEDEADGLIAMQYDLDMEWAIKQGKNVWFSDKNLKFVTKETATKLSTAWSPLPKKYYSTGIWLDWVDFSKWDDYRLLSTTCGQILFKRVTRPDCSQGVYYLPHDTYGTHAQRMKKIPDSYDGLWKVEAYMGKHGTISSHMSPHAIAQDIALKGELKWANARVYSGEAALFAMELVPFAGVIRMVLERGVYKYEAWDMQSVESVGTDVAIDSLQIVTDHVPYLAQSKKFAKASKVVWTIAMAASAAKAAATTAMTGQPELRDFARILTLSIVYPMIRKRQSVDPNYIKRDISKSALPEKVQNAGPDLYRHIADDAATIARGRDGVILGEFATAGIAKADLQTLSDVFVYYGLTAAEAAEHRRILDYLKGAAQQINGNPRMAAKMLDEMGQRGDDGLRVINSRIKVADHERIDINLADAHRAMVKYDLDSPEGRAQFEEDFFAHLYEIEIKSGCGACANPSEDLPYIYVNLPRYHWNSSDLPETMTQSQWTYLNVLKAKGQALIDIEEILHATGLQYTKGSNRRGLKIQSVYFVPNSVRTAQYDHMIESQSEAYLRSLGLEPTVTTEVRTDIRLELPEADLYLFLREAGVKLPKAVVTHAGYTTRYLAEYWYDVMAK